MWAILLPLLIQIVGPLISAALLALWERWKQRAQDTVAGQDDSVEFTVGSPAELRTVLRRFVLENKGHSVAGWMFARYLCRKIDNGVTANLWDAARAAGAKFQGEPLKAAAEFTMPPDDHAGIDKDEAAAVAALAAEQ